jgi:hypothetical protein
VIAELWSRSNTNPQFGHSGIRTLKSFSTIAPHLEHILLVLRGLTCTTLLPAFSALYDVKLTPGRVCDGLSQTMILEHSSDVQLFKYDDGIFIYQAYLVCSLCK